MRSSPVPFAAALAFACLSGLSAAELATTTISIQTGAAGKKISPDLVGIFFEDINYAADGGLYAELIQNRSFQYQPTEQPTWNALTAWELTQRGGAKASVGFDTTDPVHPNNPLYAVLHVKEAGTGAGLVNLGFNGIPIKAGKAYNVSLFARQLYTGNRWRADANKEKPTPLIVRFENKDGEILGEAALAAPTYEWDRLATTITATRSEEAARFVILTNSKGGLALDVVSVMPKETFQNRPNGLRADLAQAIADLKPKFVRFPGGCLVHGHNLANMYRWKDTIGPIEQRKVQPNLWGYHQTVGLGYFEFFQFCEDIGAKPLPVVPAAVCCQNSGQLAGGTGQRGLPLDQIPAYIQEVLDLIEYANGSATSTWGSKRAAAGHPAPFNLQYIGIGNEEHITDVFMERFTLIQEAVKTKHPEITIIGTTGPDASGQDYDDGWKFANQLRLAMVDEHYYKSPQWFLENLNRYDAYDRNKSKVYLGEYASRGNKLSNALAEAAYMTALERNADVVTMASYAPLLGKIGNTQWNPNLIYFTNTKVVPTVNYYVQQLFSTNSGDAWIPSTISDSKDLATSVVRDSKTDDLILKIVNTGSARKMKIELSGPAKASANVVKTVFAGNPEAANDLNNASPVSPVVTKFNAGPNFEIESPAQSLVVLRISK
ncbi:MAG: alpha-L-arabinofuranosidase C-terminal domain-containing protein [Nibricoccus sp.]